MARRCPDCQIDLDRFAERGSDKHRCIKGKPVGQRATTRLEAERIARGELDPSALLPKNQLNPELGRLARRTPETQPPDQKLAPSREAQPSNLKILEAITNLTAQFEALRSVLLQDKPSTDV